MTETKAAAIAEAPFMEAFVHTTKSQGKTPASALVAPILVARYTDRLHRLPQAQRGHSVEQAKRRFSAGKLAKRDIVWASL